MTLTEWWKRHKIRRQGLREVDNLLAQLGRDRHRLQAAGRRLDYQESWHKLELRARDVERDELEQQIADQREVINAKNDTIRQLREDIACQRAELNALLGLLSESDESDYL